MLQQTRAKIEGYLPLVRPYWPHAAALVVFALLGWMNGFIQSSRAVSNPSLNESWTVPNWTPTQFGPQRTVVANLDIWDGAKRQTAAKAAGPQLPWRFVGTVRAGDDFAAVILMSDTGRIRRLKPGETLPNGEKIVSVGHGSLQLEIAGAPRELRLFKPENNPEKK